jgi:hypothetical protein
LKTTRSTKGFIVATRFVTDANAVKTRTTTYIEDPDTEGFPLSEEHRTILGRATMALHYARVFAKLDLTLLASALSLGYSLTRQLTFQVPVWTCISPPFQGNKYVGGYYQTVPGKSPVLTDRGWKLSGELGAGHAVFVGVDAAVASQAAAAARGEWHSLDNIQPPLPEGLWSSEFAWLPDGTVAAPLTYFLPSGLLTL